VQYKYVRVETDGTVTWENDPNHTYTVGTSGGTVNDKWQG
jgi:hypothetical protein